MAISLVTGGAGFIGSHIVDALVERGDTVRVLDDFSTGFDRNLSRVRDRIEIIRGSVADADVTALAVKGVDCIYHQAALASVPLSVNRPLEVNHACVTGTLTLLDAARRANVRRVVYAASSAAYGDSPYAAKRESDLPEPLSPYAAAKLAGEQYCRAFTHTYGLETVGLRYFNVFGPRQDPDSPYSAVIPLFLTALLQGRQPTVFGDGQQTRDFTYVGNIVRGNLLAGRCDDAIGQVINLADGRRTSLLRLVEVLNALVGTDIQPDFQPPRTGDIKDSLADITRARKLLGYQPIVDFEAGLAKSIDYYRSLVTKTSG